MATTTHTVDLQKAAGAIRKARASTNMQVAKEDARKERLYRQRTKNKVHKKRIMTRDEKLRRSKAARRVWAKGITKDGRKALYSSLAK